MPLEEIFLDFDSNANPVITVKGVRGKACKALTADIEKALGKSINEEHTREYTQTEAKDAKRAPSTR